jgi:hypothetical protein
MMATDDQTVPSEDEVIERMDEIAEAVLKMSDLGGALLSKTKLRMRTLCLLIRDACPVSLGLRDIQSVLETLPELKERFLKDE